MTDLGKFWDNVNEGWRHIAGKGPTKKVQHLRNFNKHLIQQIDFSKVKKSVEWGCGGGLLAKELLTHSEFGEVCLLDVSTNSLNSAIKHTKIKDAATVPSKLGNWEIPFNEIDLIYCYHVIYHFPSYDYFKEVAQIWKNKNPRYIAGQFLCGAQIEEKKDKYFSGINFLRGLILTKTAFLEPFKDQYDLIYYEAGEKVTQPSPGSALPAHTGTIQNCFFVLELKK